MTKLILAAVGVAMFVFAIAAVGGPLGNALTALNVALK